MPTPSSRACRTTATATASSLHADAERDLRSLGKVFGTSAQSRMEESFKDDPEQPERPATASLRRRRSGRW